MTLQHLLNNMIKKKKIIPLCLDCDYVRVEWNHTSEWTNDYNHRTLVNYQERTGNITSTLCPSCLDKHYKKKK